MAKPTFISATTSPEIPTNSDARHALLRPLRQAMGTGLQLVSAYWFLRILRMVRYKLGKNKKKPPPAAAAGKLATD